MKLYLQNVDDCGDKTQILQILKTDDDNHAAVMNIVMKKMKPHVDDVKTPIKDQHDAVKKFRDMAKKAKTEALNKL